MTSQPPDSGFAVGDFTQAVGQMPTVEPYQALLGHPFTRGLAEDQIQKLAACSRVVSLLEDQVVLRSHEPSRHFYLLLDGSVCVEVRTPVHAICIQSVGPGEAFGWSALLSLHHTLFQVRAREASTAVCLDGEQLSAACQQDPGLGVQVLRRLLEIVAGRVNAAERMLAQLFGLPPKPPVDSACP
jgi:CRP/FNR family cyclic AMP-dependent transcriptional regulator